MSATTTPPTDQDVNSELELEAGWSAQSMDYLPPISESKSQPATPANSTDVKSKSKAQRTKIFLGVGIGVVLLVLVVISGLALMLRRPRTAAPPTQVAPATQVPEGLAAELADLRAEWSEANPNQAVQPLPPVDMTLSLEAER
jgi:hypothetical protein